MYTFARYHIIFPYDHSRNLNIHQFDQEPYEDVSSPDPTPNDDRETDESSYESKYWDEVDGFERDEDRSWLKTESDSNETTNDRVPKHEVECSWLGDEGLP